jgi:acyl phosphate:glycerol-3-phosphate acyltransferase
MGITVIIPLVLAYLLGSIPTAVIVSRLLVHADIRSLGDRNMGARNTAQTLGWKAGWIVAAVDISKGAGSIWMAQAFGLDPFWQVMAGVCAVLGHDFPILAGFHGGQGLAASLGTFMVLAPRESLYGLSAYLALYLLSRNFDLSAGVGIGLLVLQTWRFGEPTEILIGEVAIVLLVPFKKILDRHTHVTMLEDHTLGKNLPEGEVKSENGFNQHTTGLRK